LDYCQRVIEKQEFSLINFQRQLDLAQQASKSQAAEIKSLSYTVECRDATILSMTEESKTQVAEVAAFKSTIERNSYSEAEQVEELARLSSIVDCSDATILSLSEEIQDLQDRRKKPTGELKNLEEDYERFQKRVMPFWNLGCLIRGRKLSWDIKKAGLGLWADSNNAIRDGNHAAHRGSPLADAILIMFDSHQQLKKNPDEVKKKWYMDNYGVPPEIVFNNYNFKKFHRLLQLRDDILHYQRESFAVWTPTRSAADFLKKVDGFIEKIHVQRIYELDADIERDVEAEKLYRELEVLGERAAEKHDQLRRERN